MDKVILSPGRWPKPSLPSNIREWLQYQDSDMRKSAALVTKWLWAKLGHGVTGGTSVGRSPQSLILDIKNQDGRISVDPGGEIRLMGVTVNSKQEFNKVFDENFIIQEREQPLQMPVSESVKNILSLLEKRVSNEDYSMDDYYEWAASGQTEALRSLFMRINERTFLNIVQYGLRSDKPTKDIELLVSLRFLFISR